MKILINWMTNTLQPKLDKIARNPWVAAVQDGYMQSMALILTGSFSMVFISLQKYLPSWFPDLTNLYYFSIGLLGLFLAYLIPSGIMEKKNIENYQNKPDLLGFQFSLFLSILLLIKSPIFNLSLND